MPTRNLIDAALSPKSIPRRKAIVILAVTRARTRPRKRGEFLQTVRSLLGGIRNDTRCRVCHAFLSIEDETDFMLLEEWASPADFENHVHSEDFRVLRGALNVLCVPRETRMNVFSTNESCEAMEKALNEVAGKDAAIKVSYTDSKP